MASEPGLAGALGAGALVALVAGLVLGSVPVLARCGPVRVPPSRRGDLALAALATSAALTLVTTTGAWVDARPMPVWVRVLGLVWAAGVGVRLVRLLHAATLVRRLVNGARPVAAPWPARLAEVARHMQVDASVRLVESPDVAVPGSVGGRSPVILLPEGVVDTLPLSDFTAIVAHELAHVRRHDYAWNLMQRVCEALLWAHPLRPWWARIIRQERERACDALAAAACHPATLARGLVRLERARHDTHRRPDAEAEGELANRVQALVAGMADDAPAPATTPARTVAAAMIAVLVSLTLAYWTGRPSAAPTGLDAWPWLLAAAGGLLIGFRHALEPDHLAAVATMVAPTRRAGLAARLGAWWGVGHALSLMAVTSTLLVTRATLPPNVERGFELVVALMLIVMGLRALWDARRLAMGGPVTAHVHGRVVHEHATRGAHVHVGAWTLARQPLSVGLVHGLAGSGALTVMAVTAMPDVSAQMVFLVMFGLGATTGMAVVAGLAGHAVARFAEASLAQAAVSAATGLTAVVVGLGWALA